MTTRPTSHSDWGGTQIEPGSGQKNVGFAAGDRPPAQWHNWLFGITDQWLKYLCDHIDSVVSLSGAGAVDSSSDQLARSLALSKEVSAQLSSKDVATPNTAVISAFAAIEQRLVAVGDAGTIYTNDALGQGTWTVRTPPGGYSDTYYCALVYNNAFFVIAGASSALHTSPDGTTYTARTSGFSGGDAVLAMASRGSQLAIVGENGATASSTNGTSFSINADLVGAGFHIVDVCASQSGAAVFVCCGSGGGSTRANYIHRSTDGGDNWSPVSLSSVLSTNEYVRLVEWHATLGFVGLVEDSNTSEITCLITSPDGLTWTKKGATALGSFGVTAGGCYLTATVGGLLLTSYDPLQPSLYSLDGDHWMLTPVPRAGIGPGLPQSFSVLRFNGSGAYIALMAASTGDKISASPLWVY